VEALGLALALLGSVILRDARLPGPEGSDVGPRPGPPCPVEVAESPARRATDPPRDGPYRTPSLEPLEFRGAGREEPDPDVDEVVIGWFGPGDPDHPELGDYWRGAGLALEQENAAGGYRGRPFRLEPAWSETPWKAGVVDVARLVNERGAWAVIGGFDGTTTHLAVQLALKSRFLLLSPGSTDVTADDANVPWLFSLPPSDEVIARVLADAIDRERHQGPFVVAASTDHDSHAGLVALRRALADRRMAPASLVELPTEDPDVAGAAAQLLGSLPRAVVVLARARLAARLVSAVRQAGFTGSVICGPACSVAAFARADAGTADGVLAPLLVESGKERWETEQSRFERQYGARWPERSDAAARLGYDSVRIVAGAVRQAGLNRARIRDAVRALAPWSGVSGVVSWNPRGRNDRVPVLGRWHAGRLEPLAH
jgi:branched-chain amino acid transport system substrate-binding protein